MRTSQDLGDLPMGKLLTKMAVPASIGILVMSIYFIVDTIFVGRFVGSLGIGAITVVMPISFLISSSGMAIGVGGGSIISRALGSGNHRRACHTFGNMVTMTLALVLVVVIAGSFFQEPILRLFGANGNILEPSKAYFRILLLGIPALAWAMMSNNVMRAEGEPKMAMLSMLIPALVNIILDPIFIIWLDMGIEGAAWATTISYYMSAGFTLWFFFGGRSELRLWWSSLLLKADIVRETTSLGFVTLARQGSVSLLTIVLNHTLFAYGGEIAVAVFGIINRIMMFVNFPVLGITQGFLPIAGFNYGAGKWNRVQESIRLSIRTGTLIATGLFVLIIALATPIVHLFTNDPDLIAQTPSALVLVFLASPLITVQLVSAAYFQAIGKAIPALLLTLTKQGFFLIPLVLIFPLFFGIKGVWYAFPLADVLAAGVTFFYLRHEMRRTLEARRKEEAPAVAVLEEI